MKQEALVPDDLWEAIVPLLPQEPPKSKGRRPRVPDRAALGGIVFVLRTGYSGRLLPKELGCGVTCRRRLRDGQAAGVWERLHERLLNWLADEAAVDWSHASVDCLSVCAKRGRADRPEPGRPWQARLQVPPGRRPLHADKAYDAAEKRRALRARGITPRIAQRGVKSSERLGRHRWVVKQAIAWLLGCRRRGVRYERRAALLQVLLHLACALACLQFLGASEGL